MVEFLLFSLVLGGHFGGGGHGEVGAVGRWPLVASLRHHESYIEIRNSINIYFILV